VVIVGVKEPQSLDPQVTFQVSPANVESFTAVALKSVEPPTGTDFGAVMNMTLIGRGTICTVLLLAAVGLLVAEALNTTLFPKGMRAGAV
jgi:hypothetical protein